MSNAANCRLGQMESIGDNASSSKPFVSLVVPGYNEEAILVENLTILCEYMGSLEYKYRWELIFVNDGSTDNTKKLAMEFAEQNTKVTVLNHHANFQLGQALRFAFAHCHGNYIVTMDIDLSYSPDHIERLLDTIVKTRAKMVLTSPYMPGGKVSNVPWLRRILSRNANRFLSLTAKGKIYTLTGMVRAYDRKFINTLDLKSMDMEINAEIIYKSQLLRALIVEIPAHLNWGNQKAKGKARISKMRLVRGILSALMSGFIFHPFMFFMLPGIMLLLVSAYILVWISINISAVYPNIVTMSVFFDDRFSEAVAEVFKERPHAFYVGGITLIVALQFISVAFLSLQNKRYFEELFHLNSRILKEHMDK